MKRFEEGRNFMRSPFKGSMLSDQQKQMPQPPLEKPLEEGSKLIDLPEVDEKLLVKSDINQCILDRESRRDYSDESISIEELSYLLWMTQGVKDIKGDNYATIRPVASAGARHPFETYLAINNVEGLEKGMYRYIALEHKLLFLFEEESLPERITEVTRGQKFAGRAPVNFIWSCIPYRGEWRYGDRSHKVMLIDAGHVGQALYIACEAIGLGTCAIAAYEQEPMDDLLRIDGEDEFAVYMAPVGKVK